MHKEPLSKGWETEQSQTFQEISSQVLADQKG